MFITALLQVLTFLIMFISFTAFMLERDKELRRDLSHLTMVALGAGILSIII